VLASSGTTPESLASEAKFMLELKLCEAGRLSSGKVGGLCGMDRVWNFFSQLGERVYR
jgi:hypothetical protein